MVPVEDYRGANNVRYVSYRWYFPNRALPWATPNGERFHNWILHLKNGYWDARLLFGALLARLWQDLLYNPDAIIAISPHQSFEERPVYPLSFATSLAANLCGCTDLTNHLTRTRTVPRAIDNPDARNVEFQQNSMALDPLPEDIRSVVLVDDVTTSGSTRRAAANLIRNYHPQIHIICFVFGKTQRRGATPFPDEPDFPTPGPLEIQELLAFFE